MVPSAKIDKREIRYRYRSSPITFLCASISRYGAPLFIHGKAGTRAPIVPAWSGSIAMRCWIVRAAAAAGGGEEGVVEGTEVDVVDVVDAEVEFPVGEDVTP